MAQFIKRIVIKYKAFLLYAIFGILTTVINLISYYILYNMIGWENVPSTALAWLVAVVFAFVTNKYWVFGSKSVELKTMLYELFTFFMCRIATGILDMLIMYIAVDVESWNEMIWKLLSNIIVIIINYVASKLIIFKKKE